MSSKIDLGDGRMAEWTAPTTPIYLLYHDLPAEKGDAVQVGNIEDLHNWVERSKSDFRFYVQDIFLGLFSFALGAFIWIAHKHIE